MDTDYTYKTTLGKTLSQVLSQSSELKQFDLLRSKAKQNKKINVNERKQLIKLSQAIKNSLVIRYKDLSSTIRNWNDQVGYLGRETAGVDRPKHIRNAAHNLNIVRKTLEHEWKVDISTLPQL